MATEFLFFILNVWIFILFWIFEFLLNLNNGHRILIFYFECLNFYFEFLLNLNNGRRISISCYY